MPQITASKCPWCYAFVDGATVITDDEKLLPVGGDVSICLYCARVGVYEDDLTIRKPTPEESLVFLADDDIFRAIQAVKRHGPRDPGRRRLG